MPGFPRTVQKAVQPFLEPDETILAGTIAVPKGGLLRAGLSAGIGPVATSAGAVAGAVAGAAAGAVGARSDKAQSAIKLPQALRLALTDHNRLIVAGNRRLVLSVPLTDVEGVRAAKGRVFGMKMVRMEIVLKDGTSLRTEVARIAFKYGMAFGETLGSATKTL